MKPLPLYYNLRVRKLCGMSSIGTTSFKPGNSYEKWESGPGIKPCPNILKAIFGGPSNSRTKKDHADLNWFTAKDCVLVGSQLSSFFLLHEFRKLRTSGQLVVWFYCGSFIIENTTQHPFSDVFQIVCGWVTTSRNFILSLLDFQNLSIYSPMNSTAI